MPRADGRTFSWEGGRRRPPVGFTGRTGASYPSIDSGCIKDRS